MLIWHVDRKGNKSNEQMLPDKHYELSLEQADGLFQMERSSSNYGDSNDPFGPQRGEFGEFTMPDSNWWDGTRSALDIVQVSAPARSMTITTKGIQGLVLAAYGDPGAGGWQVDRHPRLLAKLAGHGGRSVVDIVGFGDDGVWTAINNGDGTFAAQSQMVVADFGYNGGWRVEKHLRLVADMTGRGSADLVGFGNDAVWFYPNDGKGNFGGIRQASANFGYNGGWRVDRHPRFVADLTGNGTGDIVGFADDGVWATATARPTCWDSATPACGSRSTSATAPAGSEAIAGP